MSSPRTARELPPVGELAPSTTAQSRSEGPDLAKVFGKRGRVMRTPAAESQLAELRQMGAAGGSSGNTQAELPPHESIENAGEFRSALYDLRERARGFQPEERQRACGRDRLGNAVRLMRRPDGTGTAAPGSLSTCSSVWACPVCSATIRSNRADELKRGALRWRDAGGELYLLTLTIVHHGWDDFREMKNGVVKAWRKLQAGEPWKRFQRRHGIAGVTRALEATHSTRGHGWHPHLHVLVWAEEPLDVEAAEQWLWDRWCTMVDRHLDAEHVPDREYGIDFHRTNAEGSEYLSKLGLEVAGALTKKGRKGGRQPWEILASAIDEEPDDDGCYRDAELWREYVEVTKRARCLTWSKGMRDRLELEPEDDDEQGEVTGAVSARVWDWHRHRGKVLRLYAAAALGARELVRYTAFVFGIDEAERTRELSMQALAARAPPDRAERERQSALNSYTKHAAHPPELARARRGLASVREQIPDPGRRSILFEMTVRQENKSHPILGERLRQEDALDQELMRELRELRELERAPRCAPLDASEFSDDPDLWASIPY